MASTQQRCSNHTVWQGNASRWAAPLPGCPGGGVGGGGAHRQGTAGCKLCFSPLPEPQQACHRCARGPPCARCCCPPHLQRGAGEQHAPRRPQVAQRLRTQAVLSCRARAHQQRAIEQSEGPLAHRSLAAGARHATKACTCSLLQAPRQVAGTATVGHPPFRLCPSSMTTADQS